MQQLFRLLLLAAATLASTDLPVLKTGWGDYNVGDIDNVNDVKIYRDVRFGAPPIGDLRFAASVFPDKPYPKEKETPKNCYAIDPAILKNRTCPNDYNLGYGTPYTFQGLTADSKDTMSEDCLFLDIYVPANLTSYTTDLPVVVWFYGGAYIFGAKNSPAMQNMLYSGVGPIRAAAEGTGDGLIFVVGNYRLGAFGWLAGSYMEENATPNAGLTDQRLVLEFVQKFIFQLKGDPKQVSAWGESAGGGSIVHHLVSRDSTGKPRDPLFNKAVVQSPAYQWMWDRKGSLNKTYTDFAKDIGCPSGDIVCLRNMSITADTILDITIKMTCKQHFNGLFAFGPAVDGSLITELPILALGQEGQFWKGMTSVVSSHVAEEAQPFTKNLPILWPSDFNAHIDMMFPGLPQVSQAIETEPLYKTSHFLNCLAKAEKCRFTQVVMDSMFMSNTRALYEAYQPNCYMENYRWPFASYAKHASDLLPTFYYKEIKLAGILEKLDYGEWISKILPLLIQSIVENLANNIQQYFSGAAISGSPSMQRGGDSLIPWPIPSNGTILQTGVMLVTGKALLDPVGLFTTNGPDPDTAYAPYQFWKGIAAMVMKSSQKPPTVYADAGTQTDFGDDDVGIGNENNVVGEAYRKDEL